MRMRILYAAIDQVVPGTLGGSTHVQAVAEGLAALGHEVHVAVHAGRRPGSLPTTPRRDWHAMRAAVRIAAAALAAARRRARARRRAPPGRRHRALPQLRRRGPARARAVGAPHRARSERAGRRLSRLAQARASIARSLVEPMRRWREWQCRAADLIVTTDRAILPPDTPAAKILEREWGADTVRFRPGAAGRCRSRASRRTVAVFAGAFRAWHGVGRLVDAMAALEAPGDALARRADRRRARARRARGARAARAPPGVTFTGVAALRRDAGALAAADIGVAPFEPGRARAARARLLLVAPEGLRVHGVGPAGRRAGPAPPAGDSRRRRRRGRGGRCTTAPRLVHSPAPSPRIARRRGRAGATTGRPDAMYSNTFRGDQ